MAHYKSDHVCEMFGQPEKDVLSLVPMLRSSGVHVEAQRCQC